MPRESTSGQVSQWGINFADDFPYFNKPGCWAISPYANGGGNSALNILDRVHYLPFFAKGRQTITDICCNINGTGGTTFRMGVYLADIDLFPKTLLAQATVDASSAGQKAVSIGPVSVEGLFFVAGVLQGTTVTYAAVSTYTNAIGYSTAATPINAFAWPEIYTTGVSGTMVDSPTLVVDQTNNGRTPRIWVKFA